MWRNDIFFKYLNSIIGITILAYFVIAGETSLPLRSEINLSESGFGGWSKIIIQQEGSKIQISFFCDNMSWLGGIIREGIIPISDYKVFWNSFDLLNFWQLKKGYEPDYTATDLRDGTVSVSFEKEGNVKINKIIGFRGPEDCAEEFKKVYELFQDMKKFAKDPPELNTLLKYGEERNNQVLVNSEISRIKNPIYLDTLLNLLSPENIYAYGIIQVLGNIGDKRAVPSLYQFLEKLNMLPKSKFPPYLPPYRSYQNLVIATFSSLAAIRDTQSIRLLKDYLNDKYDYWLRGQASIQLAWIKDYSGIPMLMDYLNHSRYCDSGKIFIRRIYDKNKGVVSAIIEALAKESEKEGLNDRKIIAIMNILTDLTGQNYPYSQHFLFENKKETVNKWINWWKENKDKFK